MKCRRCGSEKISKIADSPVRNVWEIYQCDKCNYSWRSTEPDIEILPVFKLDDKQIDEMQLIPPIPPLKK